MPTLRAAIDATRATLGANQFNQAANRVQLGAARMSASVRGMNGALGVTGTVASQAKGALASLVAPLAGVLVLHEATDVIAEFELKLATLQGVAQASTEEMVKLEAIARELGSTTKFSAAESAEGLLFLARAGLEVDQQIEALPSTLNLAAAASLSLAESSDIATNTMSQFNLEASKVGEIGDVLINTANSANTSVSQLAEGLKFAGPFAAGLGISLGETSAALGVLGDSAIQGSMAGTNLRGVLAALLAPTAEAKNALQELGLSTEQVDVSTVGLTAAIKALEEAEASPRQLEAIFGRLNVSAAIALVNTREKMEDLTATNQEALGVAEKLAKSMSDTLSGDMATLRSTVEEVFLIMGDAGLLEVLREMVQTTTEVVRVLFDMDTGLDGVSDTAREVADAIEFFAGFAGTLLGIHAGIMVVNVALKAMNAILLANPWTMVAMGISAAVGALLVYRDELITISGHTATVGDFVLATWEVISDNFQMLIKNLQTNWDETILGSMLVGIKFFANSVVGIWVAIGDVIGVILGRMSLAGEALSKFDVSDPINTMREVAKDLKNALSPGDIVNDITLGISQAFDRDYINEYTKAGEAGGRALLKGFESSVKDIAEVAELRRLQREMANLTNENSLPQDKTPSESLSETVSATENLKETMDGLTDSTGQAVEAFGGMRTVSSTMSAVGSEMRSVFRDIRQGAFDTEDAITSLLASIADAVAARAVIDPFVNATSSAIGGYFSSESPLIEGDAGGGPTFGRPTAQGQGQATMSGGFNVTINNLAGSDTDVKVSKASQTPNGFDLEIAVEKAIANSAARRGPGAQSFEYHYGLSRSK